jgi:hypothetical protein
VVVSNPVQLRAEFKPFNFGKKAKLKGDPSHGKKDSVHAIKKRALGQRK